MKRKLLTGILAAALALALSIPAYAGETAISANWNGTGYTPTKSDSCDVYQDTVTKSKAVTNSTEKSYYVELSYKITDGVFYLKGDTYKWDAINKRYNCTREKEPDSSKTSTPVTVEFTIQNYSNDSVTYSIAYNSVEEIQEGTAATSKENAKGKTDSGVTGQVLASYTGTYQVPDSSAENNVTPSATDTGIDTTNSKGTYTGEVYLKEYLMSKVGTADSGVKLGTYTITLEKGTAEE